MWNTKILNGRLGYHKWILVFTLSIYCSVYHTFHLKVVNIWTQFIIFVHMRTGSLQSGHVGSAPVPVHVLIQWLPHSQQWLLWPLLHPSTSFQTSLKPFLHKNEIRKWLAFENSMVISKENSWFWDRKSGGWFKSGLDAVSLSTGITKFYNLWLW